MKNMANKIKVKLIKKLKIEKLKKIQYKQKILHH